MIPLRDPLVQLDVYVGANGTFASPVNISAALAGKSFGKPIDWCVRGPNAGTWANALHKAAGGGLIAITKRGSGFPESLQTSGGGGGSFSWDDGPGGNVTGTADAHFQRLGNSDPVTTGNGWRIQVPAPIFPDWQLLKVWAHDFPARVVSYTAALNDTAGTTATATLNQGVDATQAPYVAQQPFTFEVKFCALEAGRTLTVDLDGVYQYEMGLFGAALYRAAYEQKPARGQARLEALTAGVFGNAGAR